MDWRPTDDPSHDQILDKRLALIEARLQSLAMLNARGTEEEREGDRSVPATLIVDAEGAELAQGFHDREWDAHGNPFRWAGASDYFEFRFFLDRRSLRAFRMRGVLAAGCNPAGLRAYVDYRPIPVKLRAESEMTEVAGRIPADPLATGATLTFFCIPAAPVGGDLRRLSFAFSSLAIGDTDPGARRVRVAGT